MDVRLDDDAIQSMVTKAVFDGMTQEKRDELIRGAIVALMSKPAGGREASERLMPEQCLGINGTVEIGPRLAVDMIVIDGILCTKCAILKPAVCRLSGKHIEKGQQAYRPITSTSERQYRYLAAEIDAISDPAAFKPV